MDYTELGNGSIDYTKILPDPIRSGLEWFYIEQGGNFAETSMKSVETSANFFKANLKTYLQPSDIAQGSYLALREKPLWFPA